jgi:hypothetical protein
MPEIQVVDRDYLLNMPWLDSVPDGTRIMLDGTAPLTFMRTLWDAGSTAPMECHVWGIVEGCRTHTVSAYAGGTHSPMDQALLYAVEVLHRRWHEMVAATRRSKVEEAGKADAASDIFHHWVCIDNTNAEIDKLQQRRADARKALKQAIEAKVALLWPAPQ